MKNLLLGIVAINLTFISINLTLRSIEPANAQSGLQKVVICSPNSLYTQDPYRFCADVNSDGVLRTTG